MDIYFNIKQCCIQHTPNGSPSNQEDFSFLLLNFLEIDPFDSFVVLRKLGYDMDKFKRKQEAYIVFFYLL